MSLLGMQKRGRRAVRVLLVNRLRVLTVAVVAAAVVDVSSAVRAADMPVKALALPDPGLVLERLLCRRAGRRGAIECDWITTG